MEPIPNDQVGRLTIKQIAQLANVSRSTVSRVLNGHVSVRPAVRDRIQHIIEEHAYTPQTAARSLVRRRTDLIGFVYPEHSPADPFMSTVIDSLNTALSEAGYFLMMSLVPPPLRQRFVDRIVRGGHFDGLVMALGDIDDPMLPVLRAFHTPVVLIDHHPSFRDFSSVHAANRAGAHDAVQHLIDLGHRRIAMIAGSLRMVSSLDRRDGYRAALRDAGITVDPDLIAEAEYFSAESGYRAMRGLLTTRTPPTAVFAANDVIASGALRAIRDAGRHVPADISLVGFDDTPIAGAVDPPLTTVRQSGRDIGATAARLVIEQIQEPRQDARQIELPTSLVIRGSTGPPPGTPP